MSNFLPERKQGGGQYIWCFRPRRIPDQNRHPFLSEDMTIHRMQNCLTAGLVVVTVSLMLAATAWGAIGIDVSTSESQGSATNSVSSVCFFNIIGKRVAACLRCSRQQRVTPTRL